MAKKKIDWQKIRTDYTTNAQETLLSLAGKYNVHVDTLKKRAAKEDWTRLRQETAQLIHQKTTEKVTDQIAEVNARHVNYGKMLQGIAGKSLIDEKDENGQVTREGLKPSNFEQARLGLLAGVEIERKALDIEKSGNQPIAIQINFGSPEVDEWAK